MKVRAFQQGLLVSTALRHLASAALIGVMSVSAVAIGTAPAYAQQKSGALIEGRVVDQSGVPVADAEVTIRSSATGFSRSTTTDANGRYRFVTVPFGTYDFGVSADGFKPLQPAEINATVNDATFDVSLADESLEEIVVTGVRRSLAQSSTTAGISVDATELAARVPIGRDVNAIALLAPTAVQGDAGLQAGLRGGRSLISLGGASAAENVYYVNGISTTDTRNLLGGSQPPFEFLDQVQVKSGGYEAEYGRTTGGAIVALTKRGTNEYHFGATGYYEPKGLRGDAADLYTATSRSYGQTADLSRIEGNVYASGPIIEDRLFFYGLFSPRHSSQTGRGSSSGIINRYEQDTPFYGARVDANITDDHRIDYTYFRDKSVERTTSFTWSPADGFGPERGVQSTTSGGNNHIAHYSGTFTDWFSLSGTYGRYQFAQTDEVTNGDTIPVVQERRFGGSVLISPQTVAGPLDNGEDIREQFRVDADFYFDLFGQHHLRIGGDKEKLESVAQSAYTGPDNTFYRLRRIPVDGVVTDVVDAFTYQNTSTVETENVAFYVQDSWTLLDDRLTLDLGLRYDEFEAFNAAGETFIKIDNQFAPRLGAAYDLTEDGMHQVYGFYGRYYLPIATNTNARVAGSENFRLRRYLLNGLGQNNVPVLGELIAESIFADGTVANSASITDQALKPMYDQEMLLGYRLDLDDWKFGVRLVKRDLKNAIEDTALAEILNEYCRNRNIARTNASCNGATGLTSETTSYIMFNPGRDAIISWDLNGDGTLEEITLTRTDITQPKASRKYRAAEFTFERPFDGVWALQGSYVWSSSKGNYEGPVKSDVDQDDASITQDFDHINGMVGAFGYLPNHRRHTFKLFGSWVPMENLQVGANVLIQSPRKLSCIGYQPLQDEGTYGNTPSGFACLNAAGEYDQVSRGTYGETDWRQRLDLQIAYKIPAGLPGEATVSLDIFNVLGHENVLSRVEFRESGFAPAPNFMRPNDVEAPRRARLGFSYRY